nr:dihydrofolate reductase family protein [Nocardioides ochotonae]
MYSLLSLDGVAEEPGNWMFEADADVFSNLARVIGTQTDVVLGRGTYDYWADHWPESDVQPFADFINRRPKHVFTSTPLTPPWAGALVADEGPGPYLRKLADGPGADIGVHGSIELARALLAADLVDRMELVVVPTLAGSGRRLLTDATELRRLELVGVARSRTGCLFLSYRRGDQGPV